MSDDTYVHEPGAGRETDAEEATDSDTTDAQPTRRNQYPRNTASDTDAEFDWRGWLLVATIIVAFLVIPVLLYALPVARDLLAGLGLGWRTTYLVLPLVPAFLLGAVAVWSAVRSRGR